MPGHAPSLERQRRKLSNCRQPVSAATRPVTGLPQSYTMNAVVLRPAGSPCVARGPRRSSDLQHLLPSNHHPPWARRTAANCGSDSAMASRADLLVQRARQLYEEAWSQPRGVLLLDEIMAAEHEQIDQVWQANSSGEGGRKRMKRGILAYRSAYPDIKFVVQSAAAVPGKDEVFVYWTASGTNTGPIRDQPPSGKRVEFAGMTLMRFNAAGQIHQSLVFRQAPEDEARYFTSNRTS